MSEWVYIDLITLAVFQVCTAAFVVGIWWELYKAAPAEPDAPSEIHPAALEAATEAVQEKFEAVMTPRRRKSLRRQATLEKGLSERRKLEEWRD